MAQSLFTELGGCLAKRFPESDLARAVSPVTHQIHIRYELGEPFPNGSDERIAQVTARAAAILQGCFGPDERLLLLINDWGGSDPMFGNTTPRYLYGLLGTARVAGAERREIALPTEPDEAEPPRFTQFLMTASLRDLKWREMLLGIANYEQGREPGIGQSVYFIAPATGIAFHMYDDRGCLVFADDPSTIAHLYKTYNDWIVEYWRETIDAIFAPPA